MTQVVGTKARAAAALRTAGAQYEEIATVLEYPSVEAARTAVERELARNVSESDKMAHRMLASRRYEALLRSAWPEATDPNHPNRYEAMRRCRELVDRVVALWGAAAPAEVVIHSPTSAAIMDWIAKVQSMGMPHTVVEVDPFVPLPQLEGAAPVSAANAEDSSGQ